MSKRNRTAGLNYERDIASEYRDLGWEDACTTRYSSRQKDDAKIDIDNVKPFSPQCKYMKNQPNFSDLLNKIGNSDTEIPIVHFKRNKGKGKGKDELVVLRKEDWYEILESMKQEKIV